MTETKHIAAISLVLTLVVGCPFPKGRSNQWKQFPIVLW